MSVAVVAPLAQEDDVAAIASVVENYVAAAREGCGALARPVFEAEARIRGRLHGSEIDRSVEDFLAFLETSGPAVALRAWPPAIHVAGDVAHARLECADWHGVRYTDLFALVRRDGRWQIALKLFHAHADA